MVTGHSHPFGDDYCAFQVAYSRELEAASEAIDAGGEMGTENKGRHKGQEAAGTMKRRAGGAIGDDELRAKGGADEKRSRGKQLADDAAQRAREAKEDISQRAREAFDRNR